VYDVAVKTAYFKKKDHFFEKLINTTYHHVNIQNKN